MSLKVHLKPKAHVKQYAYYTVVTHVHESTHAAQFFSTCWHFLTSFLNYLHVTEDENSLPHSQQPTTCPYPEPHKSTPLLSNPFYLRYILILSSHPRLWLPSGFSLEVSSSGYCTPFCPQYAHMPRPPYTSAHSTRTRPVRLILLPTVRAHAPSALYFCPQYAHTPRPPYTSAHSTRTRPVRRILLDLVHRQTSDERNRSRICLSLSFLHPTLTCPHPPPLPGPNMFPGTDYPSPSACVFPSALNSARLNLSVLWPTSIRQVPAHTAQQRHPSLAQPANITLRRHCCHSAQL
jgi:hypothetical protein